MSSRTGAHHLGKKGELPRARSLPITDKQRRELQRLTARPDSEIDYVDADVLAWFRGRGKKYQTYMNAVLRREMQTKVRSR